MLHTQADHDDHLRAARTAIKSLREELRTLRAQLESLRERNAELEELSITDELTGLYNQRHFYDRLEREVARNRRQGHPLCLLFFDVDGLKVYNDTYGHSGGNDVLRAVAQSLAQHVRKDVDSGYRYGGDEFAVILPEMHEDQAIEVAMRINNALWEAGLQNISLSFGIAELTHEMDSETLFRHADEAMYLAKKIEHTESNGSVHKISLYRG
jgi:two-component system cell cycle response regulator